MGQTDSSRKIFDASSFIMLDAVFRPLRKPDGPHRKEPASVKKFQGDACWATRSFLDGSVDTLQMTIELPSSSRERLQEILVPSR
jgi:hypothetical protein